MAGSDSRSRTRGGGSEDEDDFGLEDNYNPSIFTRGLDVLVPERVARWALQVTVETHRDVHEAGEPVAFDVTISNRLPLPIEVRISGRRVWGWAIDGLVEATDEPLYNPDTARTFSLRAGEDRTFELVWDGLIKRHGTPTRLDEPDRGEHELTAFVSTEPPTRDSTTITIQ